MALRINNTFGLLLMAALLVLSCKKDKTDNGIPDMRVTLASNDSRPMGAKVFRTITQTLFEDYEIESNALPFNEWYKKFKAENYQEEGSAYILVSSFLSVRKKEAETMKEFISRGNTMLIVTDGVSDAFRDVFETGIKKFPFLLPSDKNGLADTYKLPADSLNADSTKYGYYFYPFSSIIDSVKQEEIVSRNMFGVADGIVLEIDNGRMILVTNAEALSNYFLLTGNNYRYAVNLLSHLNFLPDAIYWDEFYRRNMNRPDEDQSVFSAILANPWLRWAFWLLLALCGIAIITNLVRKQRIVPVRKPNRNTTVEFTQTIARLYYNKHDNRNIALKMIQHFMEHIRSSYYLPHQKLDDAFAAVLAGKTNQPLPKTQRLVQRMWNIVQGAEVNDDQLLELNRQLTELVKASSSS